MNAEEGKNNYQTIKDFIAKNNLDFARAIALSKNKPIKKATNWQPYN